MLKKINAIGVDIGATKIAGGFFVFDGKDIKAESWQKIPTPKTAKEIVAEVVKMVKELQEVRPIKGVGISVAGPVDTKKGKILNPPNLIQLANVNLRQMLETKLHLPITIENDARAFTLGQALFGKAKNERLVFGLTIGTGVGGGLVANGKIFKGAHDAATEIGHTVVDVNGPLCHCGRHGCLEEYISGRAIKRFTNRTPEEAEAEARTGRLAAIHAWKRYGFYLGIGLANIVNTFDPAVIVIGGGLVNASDLYFKEALRILKEGILSPLAKNIKVILITDKKAGTLGAASLVLEKTEAMAKIAVASD
jgi:glucokinase